MSNLTKRGQYRKMIQQMYNHNAFANKSSFLACYFAGMLYGDGTVKNIMYKGRISTVAIQLSLTDFDVVLRFADYLGVDPSRIQLMVGGKWNRKLTARIKVNSSKMVKDLENFGVVPNKTYKEFEFPKNINQRAFILGWHDADGWCCGDGIHKHVDYGFCGTTNSMDELKTVLDGHDIGSYIGLCSMSGDKHQVVRLKRLRLRQHSLDKYIEWIYDPHDTPVYSLRKFIRVFFNVCHRGVIHDANWVNSWNAKLREEHANHEPSLFNTLFEKEGAEIRDFSRRVIGNQLLETPGIRKVYSFVGW